MDQTLETHVNDIESSNFERIRFKRFVEIKTSSLPTEWSVSDHNVIKKSQNYRQSLLETSTRIPFLSILGSIRALYIQHDIKQAIKHERNFQNIDTLFLEALSQDNVEKIVRAYTLAGPFFRILNYHLATIICADDTERMKMRKKVKMHYWEGQLDIATIFVCHPGLENFRFKQGKVFRGMCIEKEEDLTPYRKIGNRFLNMTFISTSQNRAIAEIFADSAGNTPSLKKSCLLQYTIVNSTRRTALDIHRISEIPDEQEVLILPYATFEVVSCTPSSSNENLIEIELNECESE